MANPKNVTTTMIAEKLGISQSTVSHILNKTPRMKFSQKTYERVIEAAEKLGYQAATLKRAIKRPLKHIGFVATAATSLESTFMREVLNGVYEGAESQGYMVMVKRVFGGISASGGEEELKADTVAEKMIEMVNSKVLDGLVIDKSRFGDAQIEMLEKSGVPFICINGRAPIKDNPIHDNAHWVCIDHIQGGRIAAEHAISLGHKRIGLITPPLSQYPLRYVPGWIAFPRQGYFDAITNAGIRPEPCLCVEGSLIDRNTVINAVENLMRLEKPPTAIFATDDVIAILTINYLRRKGIRIPEDMSVIGYGNWAVSFVSDPSLATVAVPWTEMGRLGAEKLIAIIEGRKNENHIDILGTKIISGDSIMPNTKRHPSGTQHTNAQSPEGRDNITIARPI